MADVADSATAFIDALYRKLILRDIFGKIVPGFLVISSLSLRLDSAELMQAVIGKAGVAVWVVVAATSWLIALAMQSLAEATGLVRFWPQDQEPSSGRYRLRIEFGRAASDDEKQQAERFALIAEASGLAACTCIVLLLEALSLLVSPSPALPNPQRDSSFWVGLVLLGVIGWSLRRLHRSHVQKRYDYMKQARDLALPPQGEKS